MSRQPFSFVDLFAGIGGFHAALHAAGGQGWFASEIDHQAARVYRRNWSMPVAGDIVPLTDKHVQVPATDVLAAGFPCQPFSKSGFQRGMEETRGTLFFNIAKVLEATTPAVVLLENVRNLAGPRQRDTWDTIVDTLRDLGYRVSSTPAVMSPHLLPPSLGGRPQVRERVFITGTYVGTGGQARTPDALAVEPIAVNRPPDDTWDPHTWDLEQHLLQNDDEIVGIERYRLTPAETAVIEKWNDWLAMVDVERLPGFPIWADEFRDAPRIEAETPAWKAEFLRKNAALYRAHRAQIDAWRGGDTPEAAPLLAALTASRRKLEWQAGQPDSRDLWETVMHLRPSGIRAKRPSYLPALVAITQTSIYGPRRRRITPREAARLQGLPDWFEFAWDSPDGAVISQPDPASYKQLGNGVSIGAAYWVFRQHVMRDRDLIAKRAPHLVEAVLAAPDNPDDALLTKPIAHGPRQRTARRPVASEAGVLPALAQRSPGRTERGISRDVDLLAQ